MPPPHELSRPVSPIEPSPSRSSAPLPVPPPGHILIDRSPLGSRESIIPIVPSTTGSQSYRSAHRYESSMKSRDYAYPTAPTTARSSHLQPPVTGMNSPQSRTSTRISEFDIVGRPSGSYSGRNDGDRDSIESARAYADVSAIRFPSANPTERLMKTRRLIGHTLPRGNLPFLNTLLKQAQALPTYQTTTTMTYPDLSISVLRAHKVASVEVKEV